MRLTKKKAFEQSNEKWDWHYHHPSKKSKDFPKLKEWCQPANSCPCCEYLFQFAHFNTVYNCKRLCPKVWPEGRCCVFLSEPIKDGHYYSKWYFAKSPKTRKKYAKLIRDLPLRK